MSPITNRLASEVNLVKRLLCHNRANRATATETLHDRYFAEEPIPVPVNSEFLPQEMNRMTALKVNGLITRKQNQILIMMNWQRQRVYH
ncbi:hypothetical protein BHM03_00010233 [Ensete ventricosum]|nr:hypothetical protein BHM03_00010233 [Ensete ventricosum]